MRKPSAGTAQSYLAVGGTDRDSDIGSQHDCECRSQFNSESTVGGGGGERNGEKTSVTAAPGSRGAVTSDTAQQGLMKSETLQPLTETKAFWSHVNKFTPISINPKPRK